MIWYLEVPKINGRYEFAQLAERLNAKGFEDRVEYHPGGWIDDQPTLILPHLKFRSEDDAMAYALAYGGQISKKIPSKRDYTHDWLI